VSPKKSIIPEVYGQIVLPGAILIAAVLVSLTLIFTRGSSTGGSAQIGGDNQPAPVDLKIDKGDYVLGDKDAKVTIVEFSDFQCPFCRSFWSGAFAQIKKDYVDTGKARLVYRHYPLSFHPAAHISAQAAECAGDQAKFWEMHDKMFFEQSKLGQGTIEYGEAEIKTWAAQLGLNSGDFNQCLDSGKYSQKVDDDSALGSASGVSGTPTIFINGQRIVGAQPYATFKAIIDKAL